MLGINGEIPTCVAYTKQTAQSSVLVDKFVTVLFSQLRWTLKQFGKNEESIQIPNLILQICSTQT